MSNPVAAIFTGLIVGGVGFVTAGVTAIVAANIEHKRIKKKLENKEEEKSWFGQKIVDDIGEKIIVNPLNVEEILSLKKVPTPDGDKSGEDENDDSEDDHIQNLKAHYDKKFTDILNGIRKFTGDVSDKMDNMNAKVDAQDAQFDAKFDARLNACFEDCFKKCYDEKIIENDERVFRRVKKSPRHSPRHSPRRSPRRSPKSSPAVLEDDEEM